MTSLLYGWPNVDVACVWLPQLPLRAEILRHPAWDGQPIVMGGGPSDHKTVQLCSPEAEKAGIRAGLPLREVLALCPQAIVIHPDPVRIAGTLEEVLLRLQRVAPAVELGDEDTAALRKRARAQGATPGWLRESRLFVDLRGLQQAYQRELSILERAIRAVAPPLLQPCIGFAGGKFAASMAARLAPLRGCHVVPAQETVEFLKPLPVQYLPFTPDIVERLTLLGIITIGDLARLPFSAVQAQFGRPGARAWRLAHGEDDEPIIAHPVTPVVRAALRCDDDPLGSVETFQAALDQLLTRAFSNFIMRRGCSARQLRLRALLSDGSSWERSFTFKEPLSGKHAVRQALRSKLKAANMLPTAPIQELALELLGLGPETARQLPLFGSRIRQQRQLAEAARQLAARYGYSPLYRPVEVEPWSRIPERRWALTPFEP
ncbi:MAG TPA: DNA polymerase Y family protein [Chloroflexota bacterium]|nr:DNA polymerase Y family protein [Chloroflexota bacterium]